MMRRLTVYFELIRLPNVFTALADALAGFFIAGLGAGQWLIAVRLMAASGLIYAGGIALNDFFDRRKDKIERPTRPIPSGRVSAPAAGLLGLVMLACGWWAAAGIGDLTRVIVTALAATVVLYDGVFKATFLAPALMGLARALNLFMALTVMGGDAWSDGWNWYFAGIMWLYITCVTWFARTEAAQSHRSRLLAAAVGAHAAILGLAAISPALRGWDPWPPACAAFLLAAIAIRNGAAIRTGHPRDVQRAVGVMILSLVLLDALMVFSVTTAEKALMVLGLLVPAVLLRGRFKPT